MTKFAAWSKICCALLPFAVQAKFAAWWPFLYLNSEWLRHQPWSQFTPYAAFHCMAQIGCVRLNLLHCNLLAIKH